MASCLRLNKNSQLQLGLHMIRCVYAKSTLEQLKEKMCLVINSRLMFSGVLVGFRNNDMYCLQIFY